MSAKYDRFMVHVDVGTDEKLADLTDPERLCHIAGVLAVAAKSPIRGRLLVGDVVATPNHVAKRAGVSTRVAASTLRKLQAVGVLVRDDEYDCLRVHNWERFNPPPKRDSTAAERQQRRRDRLRDEQTVTPPSRRDTRDGHAHVTPGKEEGEEEDHLPVVEEDAHDTGVEPVTNPSLPAVLAVLDSLPDLIVHPISVDHVLAAHPWADEATAVAAAHDVGAWLTSSDPPRSRDAGTLLRTKLRKAAEQRRTGQVTSIRRSTERRLTPQEQDQAARLARMAAAVPTTTNGDRG